jgi:hypothetical protein
MLTAWWPSEAIRTIRLGTHSAACDQQDQGGLPYLDHIGGSEQTSWTNFAFLATLMPSRLGTDRDGVRSLGSGVWVENPEAETQPASFQETIPARGARLKEPPWSCSDCGGEDAERQEAGLSESQPMITWPDAHELLLRRRKTA